MELLIISGGLFVFFITVLILRRWGENNDTVARRIHAAAKEEKQQMYEELEKSFAERFLRPLLRRLSKAITAIIPQRKKKLKKADTKQLELTLRRAGIRMSPGEYNTLKISFMLGFSVVVLIVSFIVTEEATYRLLVILFGVVGAVALPILFLRDRTSKRRLSIQQQLPDVMDILMVSVEAGLGLDEAIVRVSEKMSGVIIDELMMLRGEIQMGATRREAFERLGECTDLQQLKTFTSAMMQAEQLGIPIKNVLKTQSQAMRLARKQTAQEKGQKAPVKMIIPMVIFILPVLFIILLAPVVIQLIEQFGGSF